MIYPGTCTDDLKEEVLKLVRLLDEDIYDYNLVMQEYGTVEMISHRKYGTVPLFTFGDGLKKVFALASKVVEASNGILLVDEVETSIYASILKDIFGWLVKAVDEYKVQLFMTTHNLETVSVLSECAVRQEAELVCYKLEKLKERFIVKRYGEQELYDCVNLKGWDVR